MNWNMDFFCQYWMFFAVQGANIIASGRWALPFLMISDMKAQWSALNYSHWLSTSGFSKRIKKKTFNMPQFATGGFVLWETKYFIQFWLLKMTILQSTKSYLFQTIFSKLQLQLTLYSLGKDLHYFHKGCRITSRCSPESDHN